MNQIQMSVDVRLQGQTNTISRSKYGPRVNFFVVSVAGDAQNSVLQPGLSRRFCTAAGCEE
jgi:hypothetical protein